MENTQKTTVKDVLEDVRNVLNNICVPMNKMEDIGQPIRRAISGLDVCLDAMRRAEEEIARKKAEEEENISLDIGDAEGDDLQIVAKVEPMEEEQT